MRALDAPGALLRCRYYRHLSDLDEFVSDGGEMNGRFEGRRLSVPRLVAVLVVFAVVITAGWIFVRNERDAAQARSHGSPWFAGYVDVTATPTYAFEAETGEGSESAVLSFIVAADPQSCTPTWGTAYTLDQAGTDLDLDRRIERLRDQDRDVVVSFGGLLNTELGDACTDVQQLAAAYEQVIDRYTLTTIDLDLEGEALKDPAAMARRAEAVAQLQTEKRADGEELAVWLTLPIATTGLTEDGTNTVAAFLDAGVDLAGINAMTMNLDAEDDLAAAAEESLTSLHRQLGILYDAAGMHQGPASLWTKIGATPMIGQNDLPQDVLSLEDARRLNAFARENGVGRMSMWSMNRDRTCGANYPDTSVVSDSCSGVDQGDASYAELLSAGFTGTPDDSAAARTREEAAEAVVEDDPETSPYPVWNEDSPYTAGSKVVWHGNVYIAKWWNQGEAPDNPVLQDFEAPWTLVGPVMPGETPAPKVEIPAGTAPAWDGQTVYEAGSMVLFDGTLYVARWWTQGDSPEGAYANADSSPWRALDQDEVRTVLAGGSPSDGGA